MGFEWIPLKKNYKRHYICLKCKKGFKRSSKTEMKYPEFTDLSNLMEKYYASGTQQDVVKYITISHQKMKVVCPNCQGLILQVHYDFEVPAQRDNNSWKRIQKTMSSKMVINYDTYIHWHQLELQKQIPNSIKFKKLKQNLAKLERISMD